MLLAPFTYIFRTQKVNLHVDFIFMKGIILLDPYVYVVSLFVYICHYLAMKLIS